MALDGGDAAPVETRPGSKVVFVHKGSAKLVVDDKALDLGEGDTLSVPRDLAHSIVSESGAEIFIVREGDDSL